MTAIPEKVSGMPLTDVLLVNIKLLTLAELKLITDQVRGPYTPLPTSVHRESGTPSPPSYCLKTRASHRTRQRADCPFMCPPMEAQQLQALALHLVASVGLCVQGLALHLSASVGFCVFRAPRDGTPSQSSSEAA